LLARATAATEAAEAPSGSASAPPHPVLAQLTPAERRVAELVAMGLSYKEVARRLGRSLSTIDHQLRSIRGKVVAASTARLVRLLNTPAGYQ
jgi:DNA-binding CsgD family transcriptional regulator